MSIPQVGNRHQVEIGQNKSTIFRNNLEIVFLELGNSVLKYFFSELGKGQVRTLVENVLIPQVGNRHQVEIGQKPAEQPFGFKHLVSRSLQKHLLTRCLED